MEEKEKEKVLRDIAILGNNRPIDYNDLALKRLKVTEEEVNQLITEGLLVKEHSKPQNNSNIIYSTIQLTELGKEIAGW